MKGEFFIYTSKYQLLSFHHAASAATMVNVRNARKHFEKIEKLDPGQPQQDLGQDLRLH